MNVEELLKIIKKERLDRRFAYTIGPPNGKPIAFIKESRFSAVGQILIYCFTIEIIINCEAVILFTLTAPKTWCEIQ